MLCQLQQSSMAGGGGSVTSVEAPNETKGAMGALVAISQTQAGSLVSIQREAGVSELKAERALADKDGKKAGAHTQMQVLGEALHLKCMAWVVAMG